MDQVENKTVTRREQLDSEATTYVDCAACGEDVILPADRALCDECEAEA